MATVPQPLFISSRLMAALKVDDAGTLHVAELRRDHEGRIVYRYIIEDAEGRVLEEGSDLRSGAGADVDYRFAVTALLSFLGACAESWPDGENVDLFTAQAGEWAHQHSDELAMAQIELEEGSGDG